MHNLTKKEIAARYNVSPRTVSNWVRNGILPALKIGGVLRFDPEACDLALKKQSTAIRCA
jgi:excisionase family DNA binding protein